MSAISETETLRNIHSARGELYAFLSRLFSNVPNGELYQMLADISPKLETLKQNSENEEIKTGVEGIFSFLETRKSVEEANLPQFDVERSRHYTTLFCLPKSIPTDESIYTSPEHKPRASSHEKVLALFGKYSMIKSKALHENEDFIGYELLFMSKLAYDCADFIAEDKYDNYKEWLKAQYDFHTEHFDNWVYDFFNTVIHYNIQDEILYKYFAHLARGFIREDKAILKDLLKF